VTWSGERKKTWEGEKGERCASRMREGTGLKGGLGEGEGEGEEAQMRARHATGLCLYGSTACPPPRQESHHCSDITTREPVEPVCLFAGVCAKVE